MALDPVNVGTGYNDPNADNLKTAFTKLNANDAELESLIVDGPQNERFIFLGDSTSADYFYGPQGNWPAFLVNFVSQRTSNVDYLNLAIPGERVFTIAQNFDTAVAPYIIPSHTTIFTLGGGNDYGFGTTPEELVGYWREVWTKSRALGATVVALTFYPTTLPNTVWRAEVDTLIIASSSYWDYLVNLTTTDVQLRDQQHETTAGHLTIAQSVADVLTDYSSSFNGIATYAALEKSFAPYKLEVPVKVITPSILAAESGNVQLDLASAGAGNIAITSAGGTGNIVLYGMVSVVGNFNAGGVTTLNIVSTVGNLVVGSDLIADDIYAATSGNVDLKLNPAGTGIIRAKGDVLVDAVGKTLSVRRGTNACAGTVTLSAGTGTITSSVLSTSYVIILSRVAASGTPGTYTPRVDMNSGTATVVGAATDNSTYNWVAIKIQ